MNDGKDSQLYWPIQILAQEVTRGPTVGYFNSQALPPALLVPPANIFHPPVGANIRGLIFQASVRYISQTPSCQTYIQTSGVSTTAPRAIQAAPTARQLVQWVTPHLGGALEQLAVGGWARTLGMMWWRWWLSWWWWCGGRGSSSSCSTGWCCWSQ